MRFFVIDDDQMIRRLVVQSLQSIGAEEISEFCAAEPAREELERLLLAGGALPDLIVADINLPGMNGVEFCAWLKGHAKLTDTPVVMISGDDHVLPHAFAAGAHDFIRKPLVVRELLVRLQSAIRFSRLMQARQAANERAERELAFGQSVVTSLSNMGLGLLAIADRRLRYVNPALCELTGFSAEELYAWPDFLSIFHPDEQERILSRHRRRLAGEVIENHYATALLCKSGDRLDVEFSVSVWKTAEHTGVICLVRDIREQLALQSRLRNMAEYDALTGLPNRRLMQDRLTQILNRSARLGMRAAVLFIDLDGFKEVNDTYGHAAGDELLRQVAQRLQEGLRASDTAARLAGDEFILILEEEQGGGFDPEWVAAKVLATLARDYRLEAATVRVTASIGVVISTGAPETVDAVLHRADRAMYLAKQQGKNACYFLREGSDEESGCDRGEVLTSNPSSSA